MSACQSGHIVRSLVWQFLFVSCLVWTSNSCKTGWKRFEVPECKASVELPNAPERVDLKMSSFPDVDEVGYQTGDFLAICTNFPDSMIREVDHERLVDGYIRRQIMHIEGDDLHVVDTVRQTQDGAKATYYFVLSNNSFLHVLIERRGNSVIDLSIKTESEEDPRVKRYFGSLRFDKR